MSTTTTTSAAPKITGPVVVSGAPEGILRIFVPGELDSHAARSTACKAHGGVTVGRTPMGKSGTLHGVRGHVYDFAPVAKRQTVKPSAPVVKAAVKAPSVKVHASDLAAIIGSLPADQAAVVLAALAPVVKAPSVKAAPRELPAFIVKAAAKRAAITCKRCSDFGVVPAVGPRWEAGKPFKTANGAASSPNGVPCPSHVSAKRAGKGKRSA